MSGSEVDKERLFEEMHNDKAACSRATSQNEQLKRQNIELQDKFVSMVRLEAFGGFQRFFEGFQRFFWGFWGF